MDDSLVVKGWCSKVGYWSPEPSDVQKRAADLRSWLYERSEKLVSSLILRLEIVCAHTACFSRMSRVTFAIPADELLSRSS